MTTFAVRALEWAYRAVRAAVPPAWVPAPRPRPVAPVRPAAPAWVGLSGPAARRALALAPAAPVNVDVPTPAPVWTADAVPPALTVSTPAPALTLPAPRVELPVVAPPVRVSLAIVPAPAPAAVAAPAYVEVAAPRTMPSAARSTTAPKGPTVAALRAEARSRGVKGAAKLTRAALVAVLAAGSADAVPPAPAAPAPVAESAPAAPVVKPLTFAQLAARARKADVRGNHHALTAHGYLTDGKFLTVLSAAEQAKLADPANAGGNPRFVDWVARVLADAGKAAAPGRAVLADMTADADGNPVATLTDGGRAARVDGALWASLCKRHPQARVALHKGNPAEKPVTWVEPDGRPVACLMPLFA